MKRRSTIILRIVIYIIGIIVLAFCVLALPYGIMTDKTGYYRPLLVGMYIPAIAFFTALYQALKLLGNIDRDEAFSELSVKTLNIIKYCAVTIGTFYTVCMPYIFYAADRDDAPGLVALGLVIVFASFVIAVFASLLEKLIQNAVDIKKENDLTV